MEIGAAIEAMGGGLTAVVIAVQFLVIGFLYRKNEALNEKLWACSKEGANQTIALHEKTLATVANHTTAIQESNVATKATIKLIEDQRYKMLEDQRGRSHS